MTNVIHEKYSKTISLSLYYITKLKPMYNVFINAIGCLCLFGTCVCLHKPKYLFLDNHLNTFSNNLIFKI